MEGEGYSSDGNERESVSDALPFIPCEAFSAQVTKPAAASSLRS